MAYGNSVLGGYIADRLIGHRTAVLCGSVMLAIGYSILAISHDLNSLFWALSLVTVGTGILKPNISSMVGFLYKENDANRQSGYTIFFVGINVGIILGEAVSGLIQRYFGWQSVFFSATFALLIALIIFWRGVRRFNITDNKITGRNKKLVIAGILIMTAILVNYYVLSHQEVSIIFFTIVAIICVALILYEIYNGETELRKKLLAFIALMGISTFYWALYFQMFFSMNLFIERVVERRLWGIDLVPAAYPAIEAVGVIFIGMFLVWWWQWLRSKHPRFSPSIPMKFTLALFIHGIAIGILYFSSFFTEVNYLVVPGGLIIPYILIALGELLLSPIGLAMVGELVPRRLTGLMMGIFFITQGLGGKLAGVLADVSDVPLSMYNNISAMKHIYQTGFLLYFLLALGGAIVSLFLVPSLKKLVP